MLRITKVLFYCSALVAVLGVLLSFFQPQIDVIDVIMETKIMSTLNHILPREESGIMEYGDGGGPGRCFLLAPQPDILANQCDNSYSYRN